MSWVWLCRIWGFGDRGNLIGGYLIALLLLWLGPNLHLFDKEVMWKCPCMYWIFWSECHPLSVAILAGLLNGALSWLLLPQEMTISRDREWYFWYGLWCFHMDWPIALLERGDFFRGCWVLRIIHWETLPDFSRVQLCCRQMPTIWRAPYSSALVEDIEPLYSMWFVKSDLTFLIKSEKLNFLFLTVKNYYPSGMVILFCADAVPLIEGREAGNQVISLENCGSLFR